MKHKILMIFVSAALLLGVLSLTAGAVYKEIYYMCIGKNWKKNGTPIFHVELSMRDFYQIPAVADYE